MNPDTSDIIPRLTQAKFLHPRILGLKRPGLLRVHAEIPPDMPDPLTTFREAIALPDAPPAELRRVPLYPRDIIAAEIPVPTDTEPTPEIPLEPAD